jgi:2-iminoacetate synthase
MTLGCTSCSNSRRRPRGDLRRRPHPQGDGLRQPHRPLRPALHRQRVHERLPLLCVSPLQSGRSVDERSTPRRSAQVEALEQQGHKRLILVFGEHPRYDARLHPRHREGGLRDARRAWRDPPHQHQRRPAGRAGLQTRHEAGIGTYQVFQETYHHETYAQCHPPNTRKGNYLYRLDALSRAQEAGVDDVGIGALLRPVRLAVRSAGHGHPRVAHAGALRRRPAHHQLPAATARLGRRLGRPLAHQRRDFKRTRSRSSASPCPTPGSSSPRESRPSCGARSMAFGVSQIDAGSRIELGGYTEAGDAQVQVLEKAQFKLSDVRSLDDVMRELIVDGYIPASAPPATGWAAPASTSWSSPSQASSSVSARPTRSPRCMEYLVDYASPKTRGRRRALIQEARQHGRRGGQGGTATPPRPIRTRTRDLYF